VSLTVALGGVGGAVRIDAPIEAWPFGGVGEWIDVTPGAADLSSDFGIQDVWADPETPGTFYAFECFGPTWRSTNWGETWAVISTQLNHGRPWGECVAPDGSYMLACAGQSNGGAYRSTNGGVTWTNHTMGAADDPYNFDIDPANPLHAISTMHAGDDVFESFDGGVTWAARGSSGSGDSGYVFFITPTTWIAIGQDGGTAGTRRTTNSGTSWAQVGVMQHAHGNAQIVIDPANAGHVYVGHHEGGVYRSTNGAASFTQVSSTLSTCVIATGNYFYSTDPGASAGGTPPRLQRAPRSNGASWTDQSTPAELSNGLKRAAVAQHPSGHWVIVGGAWNAGIWRYVEPI
jgi:hypothetical protein